MKVIKLIMVLVTVMLLTGCSKKEDFTVISQSDVVGNSDVSIKEVKYETDKMYTNFPGFNEADLENGMYMFNTSDGVTYILFHSDGVHYSDISFSIEDKILQIKYQSEVEEGFGTNVMFLVKKKDENAYDTIDLQNNGGSDHFNMSYS
ncbi:hypothetical protein MKY29_16360 [Psychrobacillus sp. FSL K6-2365]|uniref:hypothetical protein n=1 Tax=unclassified Psychrobacillus TaxID=2636677 RepID=UPI0030FC5652